MGEITLSGNFYSDSTIVPNQFIDYYMIDANEAQVKIYLYLLRSVHSGDTITVSRIADQFNHTEKDVIRALNYWAKKSLLLLELDDSKNIQKIMLLPCNRPGAEPAKTGEPERTKDTGSERLRILPPKSSQPVEKPSYSKEQLSDFKENKEIRQLLFITEQYMQKPLSTADMDTLFYIYDQLHFTPDLIEYLVEYCVNSNHRSMRYIEKVALGWSEEGYLSVEQAKSKTSHYKKEYFDILKAFGLNLNGRRPVEAEIIYMKRWKNEYGFETDIILEACKRTMAKLHQANFEYTDKILCSWKNGGVKHLTDIRSLDDQFQKSKASAAPLRQTTASPNKFNNFQQRTYDFETLEKDIISN